MSADTQIARTKNSFPFKEGISPSFRKIILPPDPAEKKILLQQFGPAVHYWYEGKNIQPEDWETVPMSVKTIDIEGLMKATELTVAHAGSDLIGLFASTLLSPENRYNGLFDQVRQFASRREQSSALQDALQTIDTILVTQEMTVRPDQRGNGLSQTMRELVFEELSGKTVASIGEMQKLSPLRQREKIGGRSWWAGETIYDNPWRRAEHISDEVFSSLAYLLGKAYLHIHHPRIDDYDKYGICTSDLFNDPADFPAHFDNNPAIERGFQRLVEKQKQDPTKPKSAIGVTICHI